jgi:hypothetical protein
MFRIYASVRLCAHGYYPTMCVLLNTNYRYKEKKCYGYQRASLLDGASFTVHLERRATSIVRVETP